LDAYRNLNTVFSIGERAAGENFAKLQEDTTF